MMKSLLKLALVAGVSLAAMSAPAFAQDGASAFAKERWQFRLRGIGVLPDSGGHTSVGGKPDADNAVVPEFDITYFFTKHVAAELILATSKHDLKLKNPDLDLGDAWILPPTLTLQYHFTPDQTFSPYVGAGVNYTLPYSEQHGTGATSLKADGSFGTALQVGFDYWMNDNWGVNVDVKKVWVDVDATVSGTVTGEVELDPWIVGLGVSYRF